MKKYRSICNTGKEFSIVVYLTATCIVHVVNAKVVDSTLSESGIATTDYSSLAFAYPPSIMYTRNWSSDEKV
jgi:hypothetical protein